MGRILLVNEQLDLGVEHMELFEDKWQGWIIKLNLHRNFKNSSIGLQRWSTWSSFSLRGWSKWKWGSVGLPGLPP